ncbi:MAG: hypothetical protein ACOVSW_12615 [Candidatus Kapaibacteriota bacterium]
MDYQYFEKHPEARTIQQLINNLNEEIEENYFAKMTGSMNLKSHGILILNDDDLSRVLVKVRPKRLYLLNVDLATKTFTVYGLPNDDDENTFSLTDFVSSLRLVASGNATNSSAEREVELEQMQEWSENEKENESIKTAPVTAEKSSETADGFDLSYDADFDDNEDDFDDDDDDDDDDDEDAGDFEDGIDDIFEMELEEIDNAQRSLRLAAREQLRLYPHVTIHDTEDGEPVSEDKEWDYIEQEVQLEGRNFENPDDPYTPFEVPITFFGDHFTLCFSPYEITVREGNTMLKIPEATEYHVVFNALLDFLTDKAKRKASEWRKQQVLARLERK